MRHVDQTTHKIKAADVWLKWKNNYDPTIWLIVSSLVVTAALPGQRCI